MGMKIRLQNATRERLLLDIKAMILFLIRGFIMN